MKKILIQLKSVILRLRLTIICRCYSTEIDLCIGFIDLRFNLELSHSNVIVTIYKYAVSFFLQFFFVNLPSSLINFDNPLFCQSAARMMVRCVHGEFCAVGEVR